MKKGIIIGIGIVILCVIGFLIFYFVTKDDTLINKPKTVKNVAFMNGKITEKDGKYSFEIVLEPVEDVNLDHFDAIISDKNGETLDILTNEIGEIKKGDSKKIVIDSEMDLSKAYSVNYTVYD